MKASFEDQKMFQAFLVGLPPLHTLSGDTCWEWQRTRTPKGYGQFAYKKQAYRAHRVAWEHFNQQRVPEGMFVCHQCDNPACCNPKHLFLGTHQDNITDAHIKGRLPSKGAIDRDRTGEHTPKPRPTHCKNGHEKALYIRRHPSGKTDCAECSRLRAEAYKARHGVTWMQPVYGAQTLRENMKRYPSQTWMLFDNGATATKFSTSAPPPRLR